MAKKKIIEDLKQLVDYFLEEDEEIKLLFQKGDITKVSIINMALGEYYDYLEENLKSKIFNEENFECLENHIDGKVK